jgi:hypothetical protein
MLSRCAGLAPAPSAPLEVLYVHLPGGDDLVRLADRTGGRLGPAGCVPDARLHGDGAPVANHPADLGVVTLGARLTASEARAAARLAREIGCRRVLFVLPAGRRAESASRVLADACRTLVPQSRVDMGFFGPWSRQPDFVSVSFDCPPERAQALAA